MADISAIEFIDGYQVVDDLTFSSAVSEPASLALLGAGLLGLGLVRRKRA